LVFVAFSTSTFTLTPSGGLALSGMLATALPSLVVIARNPNHAIPQRISSARTILP
jgi:hypothetical protein